jgi:dCTP deaminase
VIKNDIWITEMAQKGMISPFESSLIRKLEKDASSGLQPVISYGLFNPQNLEPTSLHTGVDGSYFILPAHSYGLGVALEKLEVPNNITVICIGKSTYARCGIIANLTPAEAAWRGHLTLEFSNSSSADCRIYANEGVVQLLFLEGEPCAVSYEARQGKYQDQAEIVTLAKV